jgi:endonuclease/exonuclease/phosphatase family metal-dependent hydrolase
MGETLNRLRIATYNIKFGERDGVNRWEVRRNSTLAMIRSLEADVFGLQEVLDFQLDEIETAFPYHGFVGVGRDDGERAGEFLPIFFDTRKLTLANSGTFWFSDTPDVAGSRHWGNDNVRICTWAEFDSGLAVYNLHIDHRSQPSRERSIELLIRRLGPGRNIVLGDFNATEENVALEPLRAAGMRDAYRVVHPSEPDSGTFHDWTGSFAEKIDYIWVDPTFEVVTVELRREMCDGRWPSDHAPVVAEVEAKNSLL